MNSILFVSVFLMQGLSSAAQDFNFEAYIETNHGTMPDSILAQIALDSMQAGLPWEDGMHMHDARVLMTPDALVKIFHFSGEGCGAYCNPYYEAVTFYRKEKSARWQFDGSGLCPYFDVEEIYPLGGGYLLTGSSWGRPRGIEGTSCENACYIRWDGRWKEEWSLDVCTSILVDKEDAAAWLKYDAASESISYYYDWYDDSNDFTSFEVEGMWIFDEGNFVLDYQQTDSLEEE